MGFKASTTSRSAKVGSGMCFRVLGVNVFEHVTQDTCCISLASYMHICLFTMCKMQGNVHNQIQNMVHQNQAGHAFEAILVSDV